MKINFAFIISIFISSSFASTNYACLKAMDKFYDGYKDEFYKQDIEECRSSGASVQMIKICSAGFSIPGDALQNCYRASTKLPKKTIKKCLDYYSIGDIESCIENQMKSLAMPVPTLKGTSSYCTFNEYAGENSDIIDNINTSLGKLSITVKDIHFAKLSSKGLSYTWTRTSEDKATEVIIETNQKSFLATSLKNFRSWGETPYMEVVELQKTFSKNNFKLKKKDWVHGLESLELNTISKEKTFCTDHEGVRIHPELNQ